MALKQLLSTLLLLYTTLNYPPSAVAQCTYPCLLPPTAGGGNTPPSITMPPPATTFPPPSQTGNYPPPAAVYPPPSAVFPYNGPPTPTYYGNVPQPPDPIVPWYPFYYKDPPRNPRKSSAEELRSGSTVVIILIIHVLVFQPLLR